MKSLAGKFLILPLFLLFFGALSACDLDVATLPSQREIDTVEVVETSIQNAYVKEDFDPSGILLEATEVGGDVRTVQLDASYLDDASLESLNEVGVHTLNGEYKNRAFSFDIRLVESKRDLMLHTLHTLGVQDDALDDDYETWLESVRGVSVTDASVDDDGVLIITLSDGDTIEAGQVMGEDGVDGKGIDSIHLDDGNILVFSYDDGSEDSVKIDFDPYTVKFMTLEGTLIDVQYVLEGGSFTFPDPPELEGRSFVEWSRTDNTDVTEDLTIHAEYDKNTYTITFETDSASGTLTEDYDYNEPIDFPEMQEGARTFIGWYRDASYNSAFASETMPAEDITLHAGWIEQDSENADITSMAEAVRGAMVGVRNVQEEGGGSGSGVVYKDNGDGSYYLFTNHHVIEDHDSLEIVYEHYRNQYETDGEFIGSYPEADIAVVKFTPAFEMDTVGFKDSYGLKSGEKVYAYGSPQGIEYANTLTAGILSEPHRMMSLDDTLAAFIQHDAAISPGNSGGALLDASGQVIGMNTLKLVGEDIEGMGFALPSNTIVRMIEELEETGTVERAVLGVTLGSVTDCDTIEDYGACIESVEQDSNADAFGLEAGDAIIGFKRDSMSEFYTTYNGDYLFQAVMDTRIGTTVTIEYLRDGTLHTTTGTMQ